MQNKLIKFISPIIFMAGYKGLKNNGIENVIPLEFSVGRRIEPAMKPPFTTVVIGRQIIKISRPERILNKNLRRVGLIEHRDYMRQHPIGPYTVDFLVKPAIVAEVEGLIYHYEPDEGRILRRVNFLESLHYRVLRFAANDVSKDPLGTAKYIKEERMRQMQNSVQSLLAATSFSPSPCGTYTE